MMKQEFELLINDSVTDELYDKIEYLYMNLDNMFPTKIDIANYYMTQGSDGIEKLYSEFCHIVDMRTRMNELCESCNSYKRLFRMYYKKLGECNRKLLEKNERINQLNSYIEAIHSELFKGC